MPVLDLPTQEGWKAELKWAAGYIPRWFTCPQAVTHCSINPAQCRVTLLIESNMVIVLKKILSELLCQSFWKRTGRLQKTVNSGEMVTAFVTEGKFLYGLNFIVMGAQLFCRTES